MVREDARRAMTLLEMQTKVPRYITLILWAVEGCQSNSHDSHNSNHQLLIQTLGYVLCMCLTTLDSYNNPSTHLLPTSMSGPPLFPQTKVQGKSLPVKGDGHTGGGGEHSVSHMQSESTIREQGSQNGTEKTIHWLGALSWKSSPGGSGVLP